MKKRARSGQRGGKEMLAAQTGNTGNTGLTGNSGNSGTDNRSSPALPVIARHCPY
jgi:hypothetical protein